MSAPKVILYLSKTNADGTHPIVIRWYENGKPRKKSVANVSKEQWSAKSAKVNKKHPFHEQLNERIRELLGEAMRNGGIVTKEVSLLIADFIESIRAKSEENGQLTVKNRYKILRDDFVNWGGSRLTLDNFTESDGESFYRFLLQTKGNSKNTAGKKVSTLSGVFKLARRRGLTKNDPLINLSFPKTPTIKGKLTREELTALEQVDLSSATRNMQLARDSFVMQFYLRGVRVGDLLSLKPESVQAGRVVFVENKSGTLRNIPIRKEVAAIIDRWAGQSSYLLPLLRYERDKRKTDAQNMLTYKKAIESATAVINTNLRKVAEMAGIDKKITTHIARHTFAKIAFDTVKNIRISQELIGHRSLKVHQEYIRDLENTDELDKAADDVFGD